MTTEQQRPSHVETGVTFAVAVLQATAGALRKMATADDHFDPGLREAAAYIEHTVIPMTRAKAHEAEAPRGSSTCKGPNNSGENSDPPRGD